MKQINQISSYDTAATADKIPLKFNLKVLAIGSVLLSCSLFMFPTSYWNFNGLYLCTIASLVISPSGDIEINPGPKLNALNRFFCDMSLEFKQCISTHVYKSFSSISMHFDPQIWYYFPLRNLSQFRNSIWWRKLEIAGYNLAREDHLSDSKCGGVCVYYKSSLPFKVINQKYLQESMFF